MVANTSPHRRLCSAVLSVAAVAVLACTQVGDRIPVAPMRVAPQVVWLASAVTVTVQVAEPSACPRLFSDSGALRPGAEAYVSVRDAQGTAIPWMVVDSVAPSVEKGRVATSWKVDMVRAGDVDGYVVVACGNEELSAPVRLRVETGAADLVVNPDVLEAGIDNQTLVLSLADGSDGMFDPLRSEVRFSGVSGVSVVETAVDDAALSLTCRVNVSELAVPEGETAVAATVSVVTGAWVVRGRLTVVAAHNPAVSVAPQVVQRPQPGEAPASVWLDVTARNMSFADQVSVSFPSAPWLEVSDVAVSAADALRVRVAVPADAQVGATVMRVEAGGKVALAAVSVVARSGAPVVRPVPRWVRRCGAHDCPPQWVVVVASEGVFGADVTAVSGQAGVTVRSAWPLDATAVALEIGVDADVTATAAPIDIASGGEHFSFPLLLRDVPQPVLAQRSPVTRGETVSLVLSFQSEDMPANYAARIDGRSGLWFTSQSDYGVVAASQTKQGIVIPELHVRADAPVGPAPVQVGHGDHQMETWIDVTAAGGEPFVTAAPPVLWLGRDRTTVRLRGENGIALDSAAVIRPSHPGVQVVSVEDGVDPGQIAVVLDVSPLLDASTVVLYVTAASGAKQAVSLRVLRTASRVAMPYAPTVFRSVGAAELSVPFGDEDAAWSGADLAVSALPGSGIAVDRVHRSFGSVVKLLVRTEEEGPGGWTGLLLTDGFSDAVVPILVVGDEADQEDTALQGVLAPPAAVLGARGDVVTFAAPSSASDPWFSASVTDVLSPVEGVAVHPVSVDPSQALVRVWTSYVARPASAFSDVPLIATGPTGAAVGMWTWSEDGGLSVRTLRPGESLQKSYAHPETVRLDVEDVEGADGAARLLRVRSSVDSPEYDGVDLYALWEDGASVQAAAQDGLMWVFTRRDLSLVGSFSGATFVDVSALASSGVATGGEDVCSAPLWLVDRIDHGGDAVSVDIGATGACRVHVAVLARRLQDGPWATVDARLRVCDASDVCTEFADAATADPDAYVDVDSSGAAVTVDGELATVGSLLLNVYRPPVIARVSTAQDAPFVDVAFEPGADMDDCALVRRDPDSGQNTAVLPLSGAAVDGTVRVGPGGAVADSVGVTSFLVRKPFLIALRCGGVDVDSLQVGGSFDPEGRVEGSPAPLGAFDCYERVGGVLDTNDNSRDFVPRWRCQ